ncbi:hypothetical protein GCM10028857_03410 [Salinarchaeum chitinilyticum]
MEFDDWIEAQVEERLEDSEEISEDDLQHAFNDTIDDLASEAYEDVKSESGLLEQHREEIRGFEDRLDDVWGEAIDLLELLTVRSAEIGRQITSERLPPEQDPLFAALAHLHSRACQFAFEIVTLLRSGYPGGALARWRSLHEAVATMAFIEENGEEMAEKYMNYPPVARYQFAQQYNEHCDELGFEPIFDDVMEDLEDQVEQLEQKYGEDYSHERMPGWALDGFPHGQGGITRLRKDAGLFHYQPFYKLASESVHAGPKGTIDRTGTVNLPEELTRKVQRLQVGPSNAGLSRPGQLAAVGLQRATVMFLLMEPEPMLQIERRINGLMVPEIWSLFEDAEQEIYEQEVEVREEELEMDVVDILHIYIGAEEAFTDDLIAEYTVFSGFSEFEEAVPFELDEVPDLEDRGRAELDRFIDANSGELEKYRDLIDEVMLQVIEEDDRYDFGIDDSE